MVVNDAHVFPGFLKPVLKRISFQSHRLLFSHASAEAKIRQEKEIRLNRVWNAQPPGHESDTLTTEPPGRGALNLGRSKTLSFRCELVSQ